LRKNVLSIIVPVFNEEETVFSMLVKVCGTNLINNTEKQIIVVDDCSFDNSKNEIQRFKDNHRDIDILLKEHELNFGKGACIRTALRDAYGEWVVIQDADLEYDPKDYNLLLTPIVMGDADVVYGSRFFQGNNNRFLNYKQILGNKTLTFLTNLLTNSSFTDIETCYKIFKTEIIKQIDIEENRFGFEPEITAKISKISGIKIYEVGINYVGRTIEEGKKINYTDGFKALFYIIKYNMKNVF
jgi:glycosyltransferase involved in cell wall biosynthesis